MKAIHRIVPTQHPATVPDTTHRCPEGFCADFSRCACAPRNRETSCTGPDAAAAADLTAGVAVKATSCLCPVSVPQQTALAHSAAAPDTRWPEWCLCHTRYVILPGHVGCKLYSQPSLLSSTNAGPVGLGASGMATGRLLPWAFWGLVPERGALKVSVLCKGKQAFSEAFPVYSQRTGV